MDLTDYFEKTQGLGVLSTADAEGKVNAAVYSRPHVMEDSTLAFIMPDRLTHHNLSSNPHAAYLFRENVPGYKGKRLYLTKVREETDPQLIETLRRKVYPPEIDEKVGPKSVVFLKVDKELPLVGSGESK
ncbi:MAG: pyridoxamine 5'-phosphate oxidase family protein [Syntrophobacteraceae bacterium]|nr:pyridoxamine 5'-phosphate oxidase family protein [Syntrophobacteraceae bacterium]